MDIFDTRSARVMLAGRERPAFDDPDYIFELKLDGDRCLAYLNGNETVLISRRSRVITGHLPELAEIHRQVNRRCILDGELIIGSGLKNEFERIRQRMNTTAPARLARQARTHPATFLAFDILYLDDGDVLGLPLMERKDMLQTAVSEGPGLAVSRFIHERGVKYFGLAVAAGLEGVMAKRADSEYRMGKRSPDWVKCKNWDRDAFVICGYMPREKANVVSLFLGQFRGEALNYAGRVVLGSRTVEFRRISSLPQRAPVIDIPSTEEGERERIVWVAPVLVCQVEFMARTASGGLRQPVFKGLLPDVPPDEAVWPEVMPEGA